MTMSFIRSFMFLARQLDWMNQFSNTPREMIVGPPKCLLCRRFRHLRREPLGPSAKLPGRFASVLRTSAHLRRTTLVHSKCLLFTSPAGGSRSDSEGRSVVAQPRNDASEGAQRRSKWSAERELSDAQRRETKRRHATKTEQAKARSAVASEVTASQQHVLLWLGSNIA